MGMLRHAEALDDLAGIGLERCYLTQGRLLEAQVASDPGVLDHRSRPGRRGICPRGRRRLGQRLQLLAAAVLPAELPGRGSATGWARQQLRQPAGQVPERKPEAAVRELWKEP